MTFRDETLFSIIERLQELLERQEHISFNILNPDLFQGSYAGHKVCIEEKIYIYRSLRSWLDLATALHCRLLTPTLYNEHLITLEFQKLESHSFHQEIPEKREEKYGTASSFSSINKNEEPAFLMAYFHALSLINFQPNMRILNLGINRGDEFALIQEWLGDETFNAIECVGIDHSQSAIAAAQERFSQDNMHFYTHDINRLHELNLGQFDLIISIGTLQSPGIHYKPFLMKLIKTHLNKSAALILGFPNSRWIDGEMIYGAKMRNYRESDLSLLLNDIDFAKRYLQQKKFSVRINGKEYIFLTAVK